ncbi:hypothetical protein E4T39_07072 [Aureobasidium subglaciale]|nr:hypothetical protein E4T39_07072 [Aureobasidium subglaciale]
MEHAAIPPPYVPSTRTLFMSVLEDHYRTHPDAYRWITKGVDEYLAGGINLDAMWIWVYAVLINTESLNLVPHFRIFMPVDCDLGKLDQLSDEVEKVIEDPVQMSQLCHKYDLPFSALEWDAFDVRRRVARLTDVEARLRGERGIDLLSESEVLMARAPQAVPSSVLSSAESQPAPADGLNVSSQYTDITTPRTSQPEIVPEPARFYDMVRDQIILKAVVYTTPAAATTTQSGHLTTTHQPAHNNNNSEMSQQSSDSDDAPRIRRPDKSNQPARNEASKTTKQVPEFFDPPLTKSDFTFKMPRDGSAQQSPEYAPSSGPTNPVSSPKYNGFGDPIHSVEPTNPVKQPTFLKPSLPVKPAVSIPATTSVRKRPVWKSPWKKLPIQLAPPLPNFPESNVSDFLARKRRYQFPVTNNVMQLRYHGKGKQRQEDPPAHQNATNSFSFNEHDGPFLKPMFTPVPSPVEFIEPLSPVLAPKLNGLPPLPPVLAPKLGGLSTQKQAELVYQQLLAMGERQKAVTGKYRTLADEQGVQSNKKPEKGAGAGGL